MADSPLDPQQSWARLRILDANANRASEGLRVVEEYARFALNDGHLAARLKQIRHSLTSALECLDPLDRLAARDTPGDVGTRLTTATEFVRPTLGSVVEANLERVEQALRCLEEYAKGFRPALAHSAESLRYETYNVAQALIRTAANRRRLAASRLYVLADGDTDADRMCAKAEALVRAGVNVLQFRDKRLCDRELVERAARLRRITSGTSTLLVINDRPDVAAIVGADGVHVGQEELSVRDARRIVGVERLVGVSTHDLDQARQAVLDGADYLGCGPTFPSTTKNFANFPGLDFLRQVAAEIGLPTFAIGGISAPRLGEVLQTGMTRIAVSGAVWQADDPAVAARELLARLKSK